MTKTTTTLYRCNGCGKEEADKGKLLYWYKLGVLRDEYEFNHFRVYGRAPYVRHFCSRECLVAWADNR